MSPFTQIDKKIIARNNLKEEIAELTNDIMLTGMEKRDAFAEYKELFDQEVRLQKLLLKKQKQLAQMESEVQFVS